jgi:hypothetical protein
MVTAPEKRKAGREEEAKEEDFSADSNKSHLYRLFVIGKKSLHLVVANSHHHIII